MSAGIVKLKPNGGGEKIAALHLRMVLSNQESAVPWTVDPQAQSVSFPNAGAQVAPVFVQSDSSTAPNLVVDRGEIRTLDLYFQLPAKEKAGDIPEFDFHWQVNAGARLAQETTSFDRVEIQTYAVGPYLYPYAYPYAYPGYYPGYNPYAYPFGPGFGWEAPPIVVAPAVPAPPPSRPVIVGH